METLKNSLNWFEIPVTDFERAKKFYGALYDFDMPIQKMGDAEMGFFLMERGGIGGAIVKCEAYEPSRKGSVVYLNGGEDLQVVLDRIEAAGGSIEVPKFKVNDEIGHCAFFIDSEGNRVGLHSMN